MTTMQRKQLQGVTATHSLLSLYDECLSMAKQQQPLLTTASSESSESAPRLAPANDAAPAKPLVAPLALHDAQSTLVEFDKSQWNVKTKQPKYLPIGVVRSMKVVLQSNNDASTTNDSRDSTTTTSTSTVEQLEQALGQTQLYFTPPPDEATSDQQSYEKRKFRERMERLRLQNEENNYYKMTSNVAAKSKKDDDITAKSMTYAASVGLNMIVAPISFGVFMYFFSGPILGFIWADFKVSPNGTDIRKVIIGVICGVAMLFIEMILFVIRTHELDRGMRKKQKKKGSSIRPFGEYSAADKRTFGAKKED